MKQFLFVFLFSSALLSELSAQYGFSANEYYQQEYYIEDIPIGYTYPKYDYYGNYRGTYQTWKKAEWHHRKGGEYVYYWNSYGWESRWQEGYFYWYTWNTYEKYLGY